MTPKPQSREAAKHESKIKVALPVALITAECQGAEMVRLCKSGADHG
jgi:hypothetical protein